MDLFEPKMLWILLQSKPICSPIYSENGSVSPSSFHENFVSTLFEKRKPTLTGLENDFLTTDHDLVRMLEGDCGCNYA